MDVLHRTVPHSDVLRESVTCVCLRLPIIDHSPDWMASVNGLYRRSHYCCCFPAAPFSSGTVWWQTVKLTPVPRPGVFSRFAAKFPAILRAATAMASSHLASIPSPAVAPVSRRAWSRSLLGLPDGCVSVLPAAIAAQSRGAVARRLASAAATATTALCRTAVTAFPLVKRAGRADEALLPQQRKFSTPAGRRILEQDRRATRPIRKLLIANRGEIAIRIHRACKEMGIRSVGIFSKADSLALHRQVCDESYGLKKDLSPVNAYLDYPGIIEIALKHKVDAIHPGYGFLSENSQFAAAVEEAGLMLVGPSPRVIALMGDKVQARLAAVRTGVQVVPGADTPVHTLDEAAAISSQTGFPLMLKAAYGGGGRGMRRVLREADLPEAFERAKSEAEAAFGDGALFIEKLVERGVHIEVQILADHYGDVVHLRERDCTVQRRHQKVIEIAPSPFLEEDVRKRILADAVALMRSVGYQNAGTVEFLVSRDPVQGSGMGAQLVAERSLPAAQARTVEAGRVGASSKEEDIDSLDDTDKQMGRQEGKERSKACSPYYFIEVNPRLQVEHTVSEEVTGIDIVKSQIALREGASLQELGITQSRVDAACTFEGPFALQCRITTEDSQRNFQPSSGRIELYQPSTGPGIRLDGAIGASGAVVTPYYDSLLVKIIAKGGTFMEAVERAQRALRETKIRGITTNIPFILNVLQHPDFLNGKATTRFVDDHQMLLYYDPVDLSSQNICKYLAQIAVNGPLTQLVKADAEPERKPVSPPPLPSAATGAIAAFLMGAGSLAASPEDVDLHHLAAVAHGAPQYSAEETL